MPHFCVDHFSKHYQIHHKEPGLRGSLKSFFRRKYTEVKAVQDLSFSLEQGEVVGFLGPNGAGKTTTLKVLSGLLYPTHGQVSVLGFRPQERRSDFLKQVTLVMGQKQQLNWDLPALETFIVNQALYEIPERQFRETLGELSELLDLQPLLKQQVRKLSLGERMKCELTAALLHRPKVLFLDEPTIGLDVPMQTKIRQFITEYNRRHQATVILTSHYMADVTALCKRVIVIDHGKLLYDGELDALAARIAPHKLLRVELATHLDGHNFDQYGKVVEREGQKVALLVPREDTSAIAARLLSELPIVDVTIQESPIDEVITRVFEQAALAWKEDEEKKAEVSV